MIEIPLQIIELEPDNFHILIKGYFDREMPMYWIIDTGASKTVLDLTLDSCYEIIESDNYDDYQSAGINQGMMETLVGKMFRIYFGGMMIEDQKVALIDLSHVNDIYSKYTSIRVAGLLGSDILMKYKCLIDYEHKTIRFYNS
jgi:hypothetical protein